VNAVVATTTWNSVDLVCTFLEHYRQLGVERVFVMDFDSTDGTRDVLLSEAWKPFVTLVPFPGIAGLDSSNVLLSVAKRSCGPDHWCLFCDPDELLVTPSMSITGCGLAEVVAGRVGSLSIPRFNVTAALSVAQSAPHRLSPADALNLRIDRRHDRLIEADVLKDVLEPPWIYTAIPGKVFVAVANSVAIGDGDHVAKTEGGVAETPGGVYLLHYPFRSFQQFAAKIEMATLDFAANRDLQPAYGWQLRRWIVLARDGKLYEEYLSQFIPDYDIERLLFDGTLAREWSVATRHRPRCRDVNGGETPTLRRQTYAP
jgi:hypothetical protein